MAALAATAVGCEDGGRPSNRMALSLSDPEVHHPIGFVSRSEVLYVQLPPVGHRLSHGQFADVYRFLKRFRAESNGRLTISVPERTASARVLEEVREAVREAGIDERLVDRSRSPMAAGSGLLRLSYIKPVAVAPDCGHWYSDAGFEPERIPYPQYGCATQRNLAGMVANGRDLQRPQHEDPNSAERRSSLWTKYAPPAGALSTDDAQKTKAPTTTK
ncbi:MAG TPA: CpaD family pilus assembly lipoprotein [Nitrospiraceae bacterium]|jgi:pilus assembly protein CpaD|nr:CpaD family pilus assembly lipoprotein [Nitrospiraceae bacterium]